MNLGTNLCEPILTVKLKLFIFIYTTPSFNTLVRFPKNEILLQGDTIFNKNYVQVFHMHYILPGKTSVL